MRAMAMFRRRRLQAMIDGLGAELAGSKAVDIIRRIESKDIAQALPAEMELAVMWALYELGGTEIEPFWFGASSLPDAYSDRLIPGYACVVEIAALSDAALPGLAGMRNASRKLSHEAGRIKKGAGSHLSYFFFERTDWVAGEALRRVLVPRTLQIGAGTRSRLAAWLQQDLRDGHEIRVQEGELDVIIKWNERRQFGHNYRSSMPPEIRSLRENYVFGALRRKAEQLKSKEFSGLRCVILGDVGSTALRRLEHIDPTHRAFSGSQIIAAFLRQPKPGIDVIAVLSADRDLHRWNSVQETIEWKLRVLCRPGLQIDLAGFDALLQHLPPPRIEGHLASQLHEQGAYATNGRGRYLSSLVTGGANKMQIRFSSRLLLDVLAGRQAPERIIEAVGKDANVFKYRLDRGETFSLVSFEPRGPDEDDDWIVVEFGDDPAARRLRRPSPSADFEEQQDQDSTD